MVAPRWPDSAPVLELREVALSYASPEGTRTQVLSIERFELAPGDQMALAGPSGAGKSTFLNVVAGILRPDRGQVRVAGTDIVTLSEAQRDRWRARHIGYVFQTFNLLQGYSALENVMLGQMFGAGADVERARELLERVGLAERMHHKPGRLSVGQQQRVAVARALAGRPVLVLADEPTGNLDPMRAAEALELLRTTCREQGAALLLVSHDREALSSFERVLDWNALNRAEQAGA